MNSFIQRVKIRDLEPKDILPFKNYWYRSPKDFIRRMGVDPDKMLPESEFENSLNNVITKNTMNVVSKLPFLTIELDGNPVGIHSVGDLIEGETAIFHAHLWDPDVRGIGLCTYTYPRAAEIFMNRFKLQNLLFKTPIINSRPENVKILCKPAGFCLERILRNAITEHNFQLSEHHCPVTLLPKRPL